ncbi:MAG: hypothetical protein DMF61_24970 [Blastocatellia bacterium AA13]|nr:MAG: hypothetical protein DMF61_24970 [Blastocatellia bacterium AA13]
MAALSIEKIINHFYSDVRSPDDSTRSLERRAAFWRPLEELKASTRLPDGTERHGVGSVSRGNQ